MKRKIIISINPEHVENIINGIKKFEYRTVAAKNDIDKIIIYETYPVKKIVAEAEILEILKMEPSKLWDLTKDESGITKTFYDKYFKDRKIAYAYRLGKVRVYETPIDITTYGFKTGPQSYVYVD